MEEFFRIIKKFFFFFTIIYYKYKELLDQTSDSLRLLTNFQGFL